MDDKILYCFKLVGKMIYVDEIHNYRIMELRGAKNTHHTCIVYFRNKDNKKCLIKKSSLDMVVNGNFYSFDSTYENAAQGFIRFYENKKNIALRNIRLYEKHIKDITDEYLFDYE